MRVLASLVLVLLLPAGSFAAAPPAQLTAEQVKQDVLLAAQPTKQFVTIDQVAALALYLCSDAAAPITGANLSIDGGWTAQ